MIKIDHSLILTYCRYFRFQLERGFKETINYNSYKIGFGSGAILRVLQHYVQLHSLALTSIFTILFFNFNFLIF